MTAAKALDATAANWGEGRCETSNGELILELYDREQISLRRYLQYLGMDAATAEETVQESFLKLHQHLLAGGDQSHLRGWLYRVAHNLARNVQLSFHAAHTKAWDERAMRADPIAPTASAEETMLAREEAERLEGAMQQLSAAQRNCLVLRSQGLKYREIAEALSLSVSTVAEHVQRGLERLKEVL